MGRKFVEFRLGAADISVIRFGISPGHELCHAVRALQAPGEHPLQWGWSRAVRDRLPRDAYDLLRLLIGPQGYFPDFFTATPAPDMTPADEAARLREAPLEPMRVDLGKMIDRSTGARQDAIRRMREEPAKARALISDAWQEFFDAAIAPYWPQLERLSRADITVRAQRMSESGVGAMAESLHESVSWDGGSFWMASRFHEEVLDCAGRGLVLVPSVFAARCAVLTEPPAQPTFFYPAHGITETWSQSNSGGQAALAGVLGPGRARLLFTLREPMSTSEIAAVAGTTVSTASEHLTALRRARLVERRRDGRRTLHWRSSLGEALLGDAVGAAD